MKSFNKIFILVLIIASWANGQKGVPGVDIHISATVEPTIEMSTIANIDVGTIVPSEDRLKLDPRKDKGAGLIMVTGQGGAEVQISFTSYVEMINIATDIPLQVFYSVSGNEENNQSASELFTENPTSITLSLAGEYYIWIGCEFELKDIVAGQYDGDFVIEVDYTQ